MWVALTFLGTRLRADRRAATAIEYALLAALVAGAAMAGMTALGISLDLLFTNVSAQITAAELARCIEVGSSCQK